ncbi:MAG: Transketolase, central region [Candidatus Woesebacteria bacterium GW2011_GWA1_37_7]|uniref:Transketolase, central region n=1 Tax=Candidatus Woesebacteria bacterium GW2011_GWA1_37_7 TaxID=1618545 RepID=A0A0G0JM35_9BACT|nr:MAG: Transketolase, central region [Candidatus Woesebacteria bacterium GW2011_GWA1_37_7]
MINPKAKLSKDIFEENIEKVATRQGYGEGLVEAGRRDERVVAMCADLTESTRTDLFKKEFPDRFIEVGVAEQALATLAAGMANYGKIPFIASYAAFSPGRNWEQIRTTIALNNVPVKIAGVHAGLTVGPDGATHQMLEDIALMRAMPNMVVIAPCDAIEAKKATLEAAFNGKPTYIRFAREKTPVFTSEETPFEIGKVEAYWDSLSQITNHKSQITKRRAAIIACGPLVYEALLAAKELGESGIETEVINCHTIKPIDEDTIIEAAKKCGAVVTVEEHQVNGGLGGAVAEVLAKHYPVPMEFIGMPDHFGESGEPDELLEKWGMKSKHIIEAVKKVVERK